MEDLTPPPELVQQWIGDYYGCPVSGELAGVETAIATRAAQWGADQELEACEQWGNDYRNGLGRELRAARRPKPPSLREQALLALEALLGPTKGGANAETIRRALEQLDD